MLISSTRTQEVAEQFARCGFVIAFWLNLPLFKQAIDYMNIDHYNDLLRDTDLPMLKEVNFPDESEVTIFSAIFPHNILWVKSLQSGSYIFNPYIVDTATNEVIDNGLNVDQTDFDNIARSVYSRTIWKRGPNLLHESDNL